MATRPIETYNSYRAWLRDVLVDGKKSQRDFTIEKLATCLDIAHSTLHMILNGQRNLSVKNMVRMSDFLRMSSKEAQVFELLVQYEQADDDEMKNYFLRRLNEVRKNVNEKTARTADESLFYHWYLPALYVLMMDLGPEKFASEISRLSKTLDVSEFSLEKIRKYLIDYVTRHQSNQGEHLLLKPFSSKESQRNYFLELLEQVAARVQKNFDNPENLFRASAISVPRNQMRLIAEKIQDVINEASCQHTYENKNESIVLQVQYALFPAV